MGTNLFCSLASVPIALHYLTKAEFGLWALVTQFLGYIALVDLGMSGAVARTLVDHKDDRTGNTYGGILQTGVLVGVVQGLIVVAAGLVCSLGVRSLLHVAPEMERTLFQLIVAQSLLVGLAFAIRPATLLLTAHQRYDVGNNATNLQLAVGLGASWLSFRAGGGIFSLVWGNLAGQIVYTVITLTGCVRLRLFPEKGHWGQPTWPLFHELFLFGKDVFLSSISSNDVSFFPSFSWKKFRICRMAFGSLCKI